MFYGHKQLSRTLKAPLKPVRAVCFVTIAFKLSMTPGALMEMGRAG